MDWSACDFVESVPGKVSGALVFKNTRLPVDSITSNVDAFMELEGQTLDEAIASTLECFPDTPGGADGIKAVLAFRQSNEYQLQP